mgnify:CR=1 FL=1
MIALEKYAELLDHAPNCLALLAAWQRWRGGALLPSVDQVRPEELGKALNGLTIMDVHSPDRVIYRLVGNTHVQVFGEDLTGQDVGSVMVKEERNRRLKHLWDFVTVPCGAAAKMVYVRQSGGKTKTQLLIMPVLPRNSGVPKRLYLSMDVLDGLTSQPDPIVGPVKLLEGLTYVDIGNGTPQ